MAAGPGREGGRKPLKSARFSGMKLIRGGSFLMGSEAFYPDEGPVRRAEVGDFWMDEDPVTNAAFAAFVAATGYVTFAELAPDPADYPGLDPALAVPGSLVFAPPSAPVDLEGPPVWWRFEPGAFWRRPLGPEGPEAHPDHPVTHLAHADAEAYAAFARKSLPTEAEWEFAARGGLEGAAYAWGETFEPGGRAMAKTFQGAFPWRNDAPPGFERTAPVRSYPPNGYGLFDMIGNVWEWTQDWYAPRADAPTNSCCGGASAGAARSVDPRAPGRATPRKVLKGGSHLCAPNFCRRYRPAARWPQPVDTSTSHVGFRCIVRR
jgi:formylglycine-generating enzyme required for sulfatase activity